MSQITRSGNQCYIAITYFLSDRSERCGLWSPSERVHNKRRATNVCRQYRFPDQWFQCSLRFTHRNGQTLVYYGRRNYFSGRGMFGTACNAFSLRRSSCSITTRIFDFSMVSKNCSGTDTLKDCYKISDQSVRMYLQNRGRSRTVKALITEPWILAMTKSAIDELTHAFSTYPAFVVLTGWIGLAHYRRREQGTLCVTYSKACSDSRREKAARSSQMWPTPKEENAECFLARSWCCVPT